MGRRGERSGGLCLCRTALLSCRCPASGRCRLDIIEIATFLGLLALFALVVAGWVWLANRRIHGRLEPIARGLGLEFDDAGGRDFPHALRGEWQGMPVRIRYRVGGRGERDQLAIDLDPPAAPSVEAIFRPETAGHRLAKAVGLTREAETGDRLFDREVFIESDDHVLLPALVADYRVREPILRLLRRPRCRVAVGGRSVGITVRSHMGWGEIFHAAAVRAILGDLRILADRIRAVTEARAGVPAGDAGTRVPAGDAATAGLATSSAVLGDAMDASTFAGRLRALFRAPSALFMVVACLLMFVGPLMLLLGARYPTVTWNLERGALIAAGLVLVGYAVVVHSRVRGHSRSHRDLGFFLLAGLVGFPTFLVGATRTANGLLDFGESVRVPADVVSVSLPSGRDARPRVRLTFRAGETAGRTTARVDAERIARLVTGETFVVIVSPGALGEPWIAGLE